MKARTSLAAVAGLLALAGVASAQDLPKTHFKVIGLNGPTVASMVDEVPFWRDTLPKVSNGSLTADITPLDQMGVDDKTMLRLLRLGVMDFAGMDISKMAGDDPRFEACDLAGLTLDADKARAACNAYRDVIDRQIQKNWNTKLLAFGANPPQIFWCRNVIGGLDDLKGKKVRVFNNTMRDFLGGVGATAVSMAFAEVVPALNNGVVDCAVTGSLSGNTAGWPEVAKSVYPMSLGWSVNVVAVNLNTWKRLDAKVQGLLVEQMKAFEGTMRTTAMIMAILVAAYFLNFVITSIGLTTQVNRFITSLGLSPTELLIVVIVLYIILGMFMETLSMMVATVLIIAPIMFQAGFDPIWFGIMVILLMETSMITPPVGINLRVVQGLRTRGKIDDVIMGTLPFVATLVVMLVLMSIFPNLALFLPHAASD